jgi:uncharacterized membrane protein
MRQKFLFFLLFPVLLSAKSFSLDTIRVHFRLEPDGSMRVEEMRSYYFNGRFSWADYKLDLSQIGQLIGFELREADQIYRPASNKKPGSYKLQADQNRLYVKWYYKANRERRRFTLTYQISDAVKVYPDVAEWYYQVVGSANKKTVGRVEVLVELPSSAAPADAKLRAWLHAPLHGKIEVGENSVAAVIDHLPARKFFEIRLITDPSVFNQTAFYSQDEQKSAILTQEKEWAEAANQERQKLSLRKQIDQQMQFPFILLGLSGLVIFLLLYPRYGRRHQTTEPGPDYFFLKDDLHPVFVNVLFNNKQISGLTFSTALIALAQQGFIRIEEIQPLKPSWFSRPSTRMNLERRFWQEHKAELTDFEDALLIFLFDEVAAGEDYIDLKTMRRKAHKISTWMRTWTKQIKAHLKNFKIYDRQSIRAMLLLMAFGGLLLLGGILTTVYFTAAGVWIIGGGVVTIALGAGLLRYTPGQVAYLTQWNLFKKQVRNQVFRQAAIDPLQFWNKWFVYAIALGVSKKHFAMLDIHLAGSGWNHFFPWYLGASQAHNSPADFASHISTALNAVSSAAGFSGGASAGGGGGAGGAAGGAG